MTRRAPFVLGVVTSPAGVLLVHRTEHVPPVVFPGARADQGEEPGAAAVRGVMDDARLRVRPGKVLGRRVLEDGRPTVYVAALPVVAVARDAVPPSLHVGWYSLDQVHLALPDLWGPVLRHLERTIPQR